MKARHLWLLAVLGGALVVTPGLSCGDDDDDVDITDDAGGDVDADDSGGSACPPTTITGDVSTMRLRRLNVTSPAAMSGEVLGQIINQSMDDELFLWLMRFDGIGSGTITLETGSGIAVSGSAGTYDFLDPTYPPDSMTMLETGLDFELSGDPIPRLDVPLWSEGTGYPDPPLLTLPLRELDISGTFTADHLFIGSYDEVREDWITGGTLRGKMTVDDTKATVIEDLGMTLCGLIADAQGAPGDPTDDCEGDPTTWDNPPDTTVGGEPAYSMTAAIAASPVCISE